MDNENKEQEKQTTPPAPDRFDLEKEWADKLGMDFDSERASVPPPVPGPEQPEKEDVPPIYVMPPGTQLPPLHPEGPMPPTFMVWAILSTICCCLPAGIVAIIYSSMVSTRYYARDYEGSRRASRQAEIWIIVSIVTGVIVNALYTPLSLALPV